MTVGILNLVPSSEARLAKILARRLALPLLAGGAAGAILGLGAGLLHSHHKPNHSWEEKYVIYEKEHDGWDQGWPIEPSNDGWC